MTLQDFAPGMRRWPAMLVLTFAGAVALWFIYSSALRYVTYTEATYGASFWSRRFGLIPHIAGGVVAISTGLVQVWLGVTGRTRALHIILGRVYLGAVLVGSLGGFYLSLTTGDTFAYSSGLFFLSTAWVLTTTMAFVAVRRRAIQQHREWMLRSYVVTFAFVVFRLADQGLERLGIAPPGDIAATMAWSCWALPLLLAEPLLQYRKLGRR